MVHLDIRTKKSMLKGNSSEGLGANKSLRCRVGGGGKVEPLAIKSFIAVGGSGWAKKRKARARKQFSSTKLFCRSLAKQLYKKQIDFE